eukprot:3899454-Pyramimonas_sp.AAC.1
MQQYRKLGKPEADVQIAYRGADLAAPASIWSKEGLVRLMQGPSSAGNIFGVFCEGRIAVLPAIAALCTCRPTPAPR